MSNAVASTQISTRWLKILRSHKLKTLQQKAASFKHDLRRELNKKDELIDHLFLKLQKIDDLEFTLEQEFDADMEELTSITAEML